MIRLSERLRTVAEAVCFGGVVADVGCDHGFTSIYLVQSGIAERVIAMDIGEGPLQRAKEHIAEYGLEAFIQTRLSDGLTELETGEADALLIAGMGGGLMRRILSEGREVLGQVRELILSPHSEIFLVREFLSENGFAIDRECMLAEQGKYYTVIHATSGQEVPYSKAETVYGRKILQDNPDVLEEFLHKERIRIKNILGTLGGGEMSQDARRRKGELQEKLSLMEEILACPRESR